jgi:hypothetical protein
MVPHETFLPNYTNILCFTSSISSSYNNSSAPHNLYSLIRVYITFLITSNSLTTIIAVTAAYITP